MRALVLAVLLAPALGPGAAAIAPPEVTALAMQFLPPALAVPSGTTIRFVSLEPFWHHPVYGPDGSEWGHLYPAGNPGDSFTYTVTGPTGTVLLYSCSLHPLMRGAVVVT